MCFNIKSFHHKLFPETTTSNLNPICVVPKLVVANNLEYVVFSGAISSAPGGSKNVSLRPNV
jgi:hypothetical protein